MAMSPWLDGIRQKVGPDLLILASSAGVVFDDQGRMLLVRDLDSGNWVAPGGYLDPGESPRQCCERELLEEVGLDVHVTALLGTFSGPEFLIRYSNGHEVQAVISCFECVLVDPDAHVVTDGSEVGDHRWVDRDEIQRLPLQPWARAVLPRLWDARANPLID